MLLLAPVGFVAGAEGVPSTLVTPYRDPRVRRTAVARRPEHTRALLVIAVVLGALSVGLAFIALHDTANDPFLPGLGAMLAGVGAAGLIFGRVLRGSGEAPCPKCGARILDIERHGVVEGILCADCGSFLRSKHGAVHVMDAATIADHPIFGVALEERVRWPSGCVVCGEPATQRVPASIGDNEAMARAALRAFGGGGEIVIRGAPEVDGTRLRRQHLDVPHCAQHDDGVTLTRGGPTGIVLLFRSLAAQRAFCELNEVESVEAPELGRDAG